MCNAGVAWPLPIAPLNVTDELGATLTAVTDARFTAALISCEPAVTFTAAVPLPALNVNTPVPVPWPITNPTPLCDRFNAATLGLALFNCTAVATDDPAGPLSVSVAVSTAAYPPNVPGAACTPLTSVQLPWVPHAAGAVPVAVNVPDPLNTAAPLNVTPTFP